MIQNCTHQVLLTLNREEFESNERILYCEYNEPYGFCPREFYDEYYINKFVAKMYYEEHYGGEENELVWELIRNTRKHYYDSYGMEYACGSEINEINKKVDWHMKDEFQENLNYYISIDDPKGIKLYSKALEIMTY